MRRFPAFAAELEEQTGQQVGLRREGTLAVAHDAGDHAALLRLVAFRRSLGLDAEELDGLECRALEPFLAPDVRGGALFAGDWSVETGGTRRRSGWRPRRPGCGPCAAGWRGRGPRRPACGVGLADGPPPDLGGSPPVIGCDTVVVAAGCWSGGIAGLPEPLTAAVRPVKGQLLRLRLPGGMPPVLSRTVRATVRGADLYLVPRADGEMIVGATSEERWDRTGR